MSDQIAGPWTVVPRLSGSENHRGYRIADANGWYFADIIPLDSNGVEGKVRADLIAAAPDMLAVLRKVAQAMDGYGCISAAQGVEEEVLAAIAKATGGAE